MYFIVFLLVTFPTGTISGPRYISDWVLMNRSNTSSLRQTFTHNFGLLPVKCDVQVMAGPSTNNTGFVFPGVGSSHGDNDQDNSGNQRGGVICFYTENNVMLVAASGSGGYIVHTGEKVWTDEHQQKSTQAKVRVRLWHQDDLPPASGDSNWFPMSSNDPSLRYKSWTHNLAIEPDFVSVQIKCQSNTTSLQNWVGEGQGSSMSRLPSNPSSTSTPSNWGGLIFGFNDVEVRVWAPKMEGKIMSIYDGWGNYDYPSFGSECTRGDVRILVWEPLTSDMCTEVQDQDITTSENKTHEFDICNTLDLDKELLVVQVQAIDGANVGFNFYGFGAAMIDFRYNFGGIVYAYNTSRVRIWHPRTEYLIYIDDLWGNGTSPIQNSKMAKIRIKVWKVTSVTQSTTDTTQITSESTEATTTTTIASTSAVETTTSTSHSTTTTTETQNITLTTTPKKKIFLVPCVKISCNGKGTLNTTEFNQMISEISVSSKNTSKNRRSLTSAPDKRKSPQAIGIVSAIVLSVLLVLILSSDFARLVSNRMSGKKRH
ncbi:hypothetical protein CHS0354_017842 [Potamilus streckersoni]|uniref:Uncharacterized protein n=1 Tax=Potamilus streckersoni TaxID=2493646 RepID=A0AAE0T6V8_9BIVA|nr:hypothetical protein CHS0354_017842 [Potamilus streckersoni]